MAETGEQRTDDGQKMLVVTDPSDSLASQFIQGCASAGWEVESVPDVYQAMARLAAPANGVYQRVVVDTRRLNACETPFIDLAARYFPDVAVGPLSDFVSPSADARAARRESRPAARLETPAEAELPPAQRAETPAFAESPTLIDRTAPAAAEPFIEPLAFRARGDTSPAARVEPARGTESAPATRVDDFADLAHAAEWDDADRVDDAAASTPEAPAARTEAVMPGAPPIPADGIPVGLDPEFESGEGARADASSEFETDSPFSATPPFGADLPPDAETSFGADAADVRAAAFAAGGYEASPGFNPDSGGFGGEAAPAADAAFDAQAEDPADAFSGASEGFADVAAAAEQQFDSSPPESDWLHDSHSHEPAAPADSADHLTMHEAVRRRMRAAHDGPALRPVQRIPPGGQPNGPPRADETPRDDADRSGRAILSREEIDALLAVDRPDGNGAAR